MPTRASLLFFFFNDTATTEIYTLSLHDALPISFGVNRMEQSLTVNGRQGTHVWRWRLGTKRLDPRVDRKSTRLNSSHSQISYAVFCLKKKNKWQQSPHVITYIETKTH